MRFKGTITFVGEVVTGQSKSGRAYSRQDAVLTYDNSNANYPKSIVFSTMNDHIEKLNLQQGVEYELEIDFTTREYQGKHYMSASCWKATPLANVATPTQAPAQQGCQAAYPPPQQAQPTPPPTQGDELPF